MSEHGGIEAGAEIAQIPDRVPGLLQRRGDRLARVRVGRPAVGPLEREDHVDQPLLGAVMEVASEPPPLVECRLHDARSRRVDRIGPAALGLGAIAFAQIAKHDHRATAAVDRHRR